MTTTYTPNTAIQATQERLADRRPTLHPTLVDGVQASPVLGERQVLTPGALELVAQLHRRFGARRRSAERRVGKECGSRVQGEQSGSVREREGTRDDEAAGGY